MAGLRCSDRICCQHLSDGISSRRFGIWCSSARADWAVARRRPVSACCSYSNLRDRSSRSTTWSSSRPLVCWSNCCCCWGRCWRLASCLLRIVDPSRLNNLVVIHVERANSWSSRARSCTRRSSSGCRSRTTCVVICSISTFEKGAHFLLLSCWHRCSWICSDCSTRSVQPALEK